MNSIPPNSVQIAHLILITIISCFFFLFWKSERNASEKLRKDWGPIWLGLASFFWVVPILFIWILFWLELDTVVTNNDGDIIGRPIWIKTILYLLSLINSALFVLSYKYFDNAPQKIYIKKWMLDLTDYKIWAITIPVIAFSFTLIFEDNKLLHPIPHLIYAVFTLFLLGLGVTKSFKYKDKDDFAKISQGILLLIFLYQFIPYIPEKYIIPNSFPSIFSMVLSVSLLFLLFLLIFFSVKEEAQKISPKNLKIKICGQVEGNYKNFVVIWEIDNESIETIHTFANFKGLLHLAINRIESFKNDEDVYLNKNKIGNKHVLSRIFKAIAFFEILNNNKNLVVEDLKEKLRIPKNEGENPNFDKIYYDAYVKKAKYFERNFIEENTNKSVKLRVLPNKIDFLLIQLIQDLKNIDPLSASEKKEIEKFINSLQQFSELGQNIKPTNTE